MKEKLFSALIKGTVIAVVIMGGLYLVDDEPPIDISWLGLGGIAWLLSCGIFLLPGSGNGSVEDGNGGGNGGNGNGGDD